MGRKLLHSQQQRALGRLPYRLHDLNGSIQRRPEGLQDQIARFKNPAGVGNRWRIPQPELPEYGVDILCQLPCCFLMQRIYDKRLTTMSGGNLSIRDAEGNIWITPASIDKGTLSRKDIICVRPDGVCEGSHKPSSELPFHRSVYRLRPDLNAVLHAHPPALVAFSVVRKLPNLDLIPSVRHICRDVKFAAYAVPGSQELSLEIGKVFEQGCNIALLENHGVCVGAPDMFTAFQQFETLNYVK